MTTITDNGDGTYKLEFDQGATSVFHVDVYTDEEKTELADLTGYMARGMCRASYGVLAKYPVLMDIVCSVSGGRVTCSILPSASSASSTLTGVYDVEIYSPTDDEIVYRVHRGTWVMSPEVTI